MYYQIGTAEPFGVVGSRAAEGDTLEAALAETRSRSRARHVKEAWVRTVEGGRMGDIIATFVDGDQIE